MPTFSRFFLSFVRFSVSKTLHSYTKNRNSVTQIKYNPRVAFIKNVIQLYQSCTVKYKKRRVIRLTKCIIVVTLLFTGGSCHERGVINHWGLGITLQRNKRSRQCWVGGGLQQSPATLAPHPASQTNANVSRTIPRL